MSAIERSGNPVCRVEFAGDPPEAVWHGLFGGAPVVKGEVTFARTSDGATHYIK